MTNEQRFGSQDLWLPRSFHSEFKDHLVGGDVHKAFPRQVDLWWYALAVGVRRRHRSRLPERDQLVKFNDGGILESDPWRLTHLRLLVLAEEGQDATTSPSTIIQIANEFAFTGCTTLTDNLRDVIDYQHRLLDLIKEFESFTPS